MYALPLVVYPAVEFSVAIIARVQQIAIADGTIDAPFVIRDIIDFHYVSVRGYRQTAFPAQYVVFHLGNDTGKLFTRKNVHCVISFRPFKFTDGTQGNYPNDLLIWRLLRLLHDVLNNRLHVIIVHLD